MHACGLLPTRGTITAVRQTPRLPKNTCKAVPGGDQNPREGSNSPPQRVLSNDLSSADPSQSHSSTSSTERSTAPLVGVDASTGQLDSSSDAFQDFPPERSQQQRKQLDVNRAVQLLKLTTSRSDSKSTSQLPPWFTRTRDEFQDMPDSALSEEVDLGATSNTSTIGNVKPLVTLQDAPSGSLADSAASSSSGASMGSRWRSKISSSTNGSSSARGRRMYSASDPIRRPRSRSGQHEWTLLPWQVSCLICVSVFESLCQTLRVRI